jgi:hypothetical protein
LKLRSGCPGDISALISDEAIDSTGPSLKIVQKVLVKVSTEEVT